jgi:hypothetical protein
LFYQATGETITQKILWSSWVVKRKLSFRNSIGSQVQMEDYFLKYFIFKENSKNNTPERKMVSETFQPAYTRKCRIPHSIDENHIENFFMVQRQGEIYGIGGILPVSIHRGIDERETVSRIHQAIHPPSTGKITP